MDASQSEEKDRLTKGVSSDKSADMLFSEELEPIRKQLNTLTDKYGVKEGISLQMDKKRGWWAIIDVGQFK